jgi:transcription elongation factor Elf1
MAKEKALKADTEKEGEEITFTCKFCGESKPIGEMILQTRFFPVLASCRECDRILQSLKTEELIEDIEDKDGSALQEGFIEESKNSF